MSAVCETGGRGFAGHPNKINRTTLNFTWLKRLKHCVSYCACWIPVARKEYHVEVPLPEISSVSLTGRSLAAITPTSFSFTEEGPTTPGFRPLTYSGREFHPAHMPRNHHQATQGSFYSSTSGAQSPVPSTSAWPLRLTWPGSSGAPKIQTKCSRIWPLGYGDTSLTV